MIKRNNTTQENALPVARSPRWDDVLTGLERELRHPVTTLIAASGLLAEQLGPDHPATGFAWLIRNESGRLHDRLRDMDLLSLPLAYRPRETDLRPMLIERAAEFERKARERKTLFHARISGGPLRVWADPEGVALAVDRAVQAASAASPRGGEVVLEAQRTTDGGAVVRVADSGPAVPSALLKDLFTPYVNAPGRRPGLGLAVFRRLVEHLGGGVSAANRPGGGLIVEARLGPCREGTWGLQTRRKSDDHVSCR